MARHGGGRGGGFGDHDGMPHVGTITSTLLVAGVIGLVRMPFTRPGMTLRVIISAIIATPLTVMAELGDTPMYAHLWWDAMAFVLAAWCAEARDEKPHATLTIQQQWARLPLAPWEVADVDDDGEISTYEAPPKQQGGKH